jgi:outer membrane protein
MKRIIGTVAVAILLVATVQNSIAQNDKFGHVNSNELIQMLPEFDSAIVELETLQQELGNTLELMNVELNNKSEEYYEEMNNLTDIVRQTKEQELVDLNRRIQEFQVNAQNRLQTRQEALYQPIYVKVDKAIKDVGKENGFIYIFNAANLLYFDDTKSTDVMDLAKAKLGFE